MKPTKYCLPIIASSVENVRRHISAHSEGYDVFEIWLDYLAPFEASGMTDLVQQYPDQLVLVFRRQELADMHSSTDDRLELLRALADSSVMFDLDITTQQPELEYMRRQGKLAHVIGSYHNYASTPADGELTSIADQIADMDVAVVKIATHCNEDSDALRLLALLCQLRALSNRYIILGMGEHGLATRLMGPVWGNELTFAPVTPDQASASGQLTRHQYLAIDEALRP